MMALAMFAVTVIAIILGFWLQNNRLLIAGLGLLVLTGLIFIWFRVLAGSARCSLCFCPVLTPKREPTSSKHKTLLGSHRLRVMTDILGKGEFRCPYCNEPTICELKTDSNSASQRRTPRR